MLLLRQMGDTVMGMATPSVGGALMLLCLLSGVNSYSKFGRTCKDIGCSPKEECILVSQACGYNQEDGHSCGSYPTCQRKADGHAPAVNPSVSSGSTHNMHAGGSNVPPANGHGRGVNPASGGSGGYGGFSAGGHGNYPAIPDGASTGGGYNPYAGGYAPGANNPGGYYPGRQNPGGYYPGGQNPGGYYPGGQNPGGFYPGGYPQPGGGGGGGGGYGGGMGGHTPTPTKEKESGGFLSSWLKDPNTLNMVAGYLARGLSGGGSGSGSGTSGGHQPSGGGRTGNNILDGLAGVLTGGGSPSHSSGSNTASNFIGSLLSGGGGGSSSGGGGGGGSALIDFIGSKKFGGLFSEKPAASDSGASVGGSKSYPTQPPPYQG